MHVWVHARVFALCCVCCACACQQTSPSHVDSKNNRQFEPVATIIGIIIRDVIFHTQYPFLPVVRLMNSGDLASHK